MHFSRSVGKFVGKTLTWEGIQVRGIETLGLVALLAVVPVVSVSLTPQEADTLDRIHILHGTADLLCDIPEYDMGINVLSNVRGTGLVFAARTSPLINPELRISNTSLTYSFSATLAGSSVEAILRGVGKGTIINLTIEVIVSATRFRQPGGPGTTIFINASDITSESSEILRGVFRHASGRVFTFQIILDSFARGAVILEPESSDPVTRLESKQLQIFSARVSGFVMESPRA